MPAKTNPGPVTKRFDFMQDGEPVNLEQLGMPKAVFTRQ